MSTPSPLQAFASRLGYAFSDVALLEQALIHGSASTPASGDNQRLEFLGDRVLGLVISEALLQADARAPEGVLAPRFNALVRKETCAHVARSIDLGAVLRLGRSEMLSGGRRKEALLGDAMEAVIAAIYLDGGLDAARDVILRLWQDRFATVKEDARDPKTALQEWAQSRKLPPPTYTLARRSGPDHAPLFTIRVDLSSGESAQAEAGSKRQAEQSAAKTLLTALLEKGD
ncbi:MAG: ribonuclease III [Mangrovicoccus sp.]|nr:ribonuclease III [Mangrovicoccus sp.]